MLRLIVTMTLALATSAALAQRTLEIVGNMRAYELALRDVIMPNGGAGTTIFKTCTSCETIAMGVNSATRYEFGGQELALADFLAAVEELRITTEGAAGVGIFYEYGNDRVSLIAVYPPR
jgi:hypothetical protein